MLAAVLVADSARAWTDQAPFIGGGVAVIVLIVVLVLLLTGRL
jgi:hypothetical protein